MDNGEGVRGVLRLSERQNRLVAAALSVLAFALIAVFVAVVGIIVVKVLSFASAAITPVIVAFFLSMLFKPYFNWLRGVVRNPTLALVLLFASILLPLGALVWFGGSILAEQVVNLVQAAPTVVQRTSEWINGGHPDLVALLAKFGLTDEQLLFFTDPARFAGETIGSLGSAYGADAMKYGFGFLKHLLSLLSWLLVLVFLCYFIVSPEKRTSDIVAQMPFLKPETRRFVEDQVTAFTDIVVSFFRRQVVICLIEGVMYGLGFTFVGLPYGFLIGFSLGSLNLIPFFGTIVCMALAVPLAYFGDGGSMLRLAGVVAVWAAGQLADGYVITPKIQGDRTGLNYAEVIFAFMFWGTVFHSFLGLLLAIPLSAFCKVLWRAVKAKYITGVI